MDGGEELVDAPRERLDEIAVHAGQEPVGHLDERHVAAQGRVHRAQLEADVAAPDDEELGGDLGELERARRVHHARGPAPEARQHGGQRSPSRRWRA